ncbi:MAG: class I SAM-dependent methyltransferase [Spirochaetales bacterium]
MSTNDFYTVLADHYDELFRPSEGALQFIRQEAASAAVAGAAVTQGERGAGRKPRVLDVACGTGAWVRRLGELDFDVSGVDLSERMIARGKELARSKSIDPERLRIGAMMEIDTDPAAPFDLVFCVGNSISHLGSIEQVERFVSTARAALCPSGTLVLQYVTVGSLESGATFELPALEAEGASLERTYRRSSANEIQFDAKLHVAGEAPRAISQRLLVIEDEGMMLALREAGFGKIEVYGGFDRSEPGETGWVRVIRAA